jgi:uncharacterized membrane protein
MRRVYPVYCSDVEGLKAACGSLIRLTSIFLAPSSAPLFFIAVGSQANIGGAASAPVIAAAFHPALAPVGALLGVLGVLVGTFGGWVCALLMEQAAPK